MKKINVGTSREGHSAPITGVSVSKDRRCVATSSYDGTIKIWDLGEAGILTERATGRHMRLVNSLAWSPTSSVLASASADKTVAVWSYRDGRLQLTNVLSRHTDDVNSVAWLPDGRRLVCVSEDGKATAWNADSGQFLGEIASHKTHCMMVSTNSTGLVVTVGEDGQAMLLSPDFEVLATAAFDTSIEGCAWSPDAERLAIARDDGRVDVLDKGLEVIATAVVSTSAARSVSWSATGEHLAVGSYEGGIRILDSTSLIARLHVTHRSLWTRSIAYASDVIVAGGFGSEPLVFDATRGDVLSGGGEQLRGPNALLAREGAVLVGTDSGEILRCSENGGDIVSLAHLDSPVLSLAASKDAVFAGTYGGEVVKLTGGHQALKPAAVGAVDAPIPSLCVFGERVIAGTYNGELVSFGTDAMDVTDRNRAHEGSIKSLARTSDGHLAAASTDRTVSVGTFTNRTPVLQHGNLVNDVAYAGGFIASASRDRTVQVARLVHSNGGPEAVDVRVLTGADESVKCVGLIPQGDRVAVLAGSYDFSVYLWDVDFSQPATERDAHQVVYTFGQAVSVMSPGPDGVLYAAGWDGEIVRLTLRLSGERLNLDTSTVATCLSCAAL
jgi:toxoflavin biosynthesis protein ToxC